MLKLVTGTRRYRYGSNCSQFRGVAIISPWSSTSTSREGGQEEEEKKRARLVPAMLAFSGRRLTATWNDRLY